MKIEQYDKIRQYGNMKNSTDGITLLKQTKRKSKVNYEKTPTKVEVETFWNSA